MLKQRSVPSSFRNERKAIPVLSVLKCEKGPLIQRQKKIGCNKVAYAHHKDDVVETMLLSLIYEGRFHTFSPKTYLDRMDLTVIRPLLFVDEADVIGFKNKYGIEIEKSPCPVDGYTKRQYAKELLHEHIQRKSRDKRADVYCHPQQQYQRLAAC